jgi:hypothetical protein
MSTSHAIDQGVQVSAPAPRSRFRGYLVRRGRQLRRALLILTIGLLFMAGVLEGWRGARMIGLPDIGDPFDVAAFRAFRVPEEQDAFVLLRQAQDKLLSPMPHVPVAVRRAGPERWSKAAPELRDWVAANRDVLEMYRNASERPDGVLHRRFDRFDEHFYLHLDEFKWLALLEASRLEEQGDMAGAWSWYRAVFRMRAHVMRRGTSFQRLLAGWSSSGLQERIASWAADWRTGVPLLREALRDVRAAEPRPEWEVFSLKVDYLYLMSELDDEWGRVQNGDTEDQHLVIAGEELPPDFARRIYAVRRYYSTEPERSRRVLSLAFANWLAFVADEHRRNRQPAVRATLHSSKRSNTTFFYSVSPDAPAAARKMAPDRLAEWLAGTLDAKLLLRSWNWPPVRTTEQRDYRALVVTLAGELFERERGSPPLSDQALVGPYLDHLPSDGSEELDDGSAPTIGDDKRAPNARPG